MVSGIHLNPFNLLRIKEQNNKTTKQRRFVNGNLLRKESSIVFI